MTLKCGDGKNEATMTEISDNIINTMFMLGNHFKINTYGSIFYFLLRCIKTVLSFLIAGAGTEPIHQCLSY